MSEVGDTRGGTGDREHDPENAAAPQRSLARMLLWSSVDLDDRGLSPDAMGVAAGIAFASAMAVLYFLGEGWSTMRMVQGLTIVAGLAVGIAGTYDVLTRRPIQLLVPVAHLLAVVLVLTAAVRLSGYRSESRVVLAWSLGLHLCLLPLSTRLWAIFFGERANARDVTRRRRLLDQAESGAQETIMIRVLDSEPGFTEAKVIGETGAGVIRLPTFLLMPRPRPGLIYVLSKAIVINRTVPGSEERGEWARYVVSAEDSVLLGDRPEITEPAESAQLARRAFTVIVATSAALSVLSLVAGL